ncbi:MAG: carboxypeptidase-like regulatory domain-containing protein, partial [Rikenellaceae bacterium]
MNKNYTLLFVIFLFTTLKTFAQDISISGRIIDKTKSPLEMVQVILKHKNSGKTAAYAISDIKGAFVLKKDIKGVSRDSLSLEFKCI